MRILRFEATNIQRLSAVEIEPTGDPVLVLAGDNGEGKSSCLDAIEMALGGERAQPPEPIRRGSDKAAVTLDLGDIIVTRKFSRESKGSITVTNRDGLKYPSPQALLDGLYSKLTFDPLAFASAKPADQAFTLRALAKVDTSDIEVARKQAYDSRTLMNRDLARARGAAASMVKFDDVGTELEDPNTVIAALEQADRLAGVAAEARTVQETTRGLVAGWKRRLADAERGVEQAREALKRAERVASEAATEVDAAETAEREARQNAESAASAVPDRNALRNDLSALQARNERVRGNIARAATVAEAERLQGIVNELTTRIDSLDSEKADRLAKASFPIEGLGLGDDGVTWQDLPFEQASTAIRTRVSVAIGLALHPKLKVLLIRNGNDLDGKSLQAIAEQAEAAGAQLWIERIAGGNGLQTVVIEDGTVKA
jgi:DNA repair exonuclease SbcCD ATPase subunit